MSKHTKVTWFINGNQRYTKYIESRIGGGMIQEVAACGPTEGHGEQEANARLIAAAPDLLEALEAFVNYNAEANGDVSIMSNDSLWIKAESAIAKARGEA